MPTATATDAGDGATTGDATAGDGTAGDATASDATTGDATAGGATAGDGATTGTLLAALALIPDHRTRKGKRYPLPAILLIALAAMLSGANNLLAVCRWGRRLSPKALQALGCDPKRRKAPCHATYHNVFKALAADDLVQVLGRLVAAEAQAAGGLGHVAIDGKRLRGSQHATSPGVHMLHAFSTKLRAVVGSLEVPPDSGECITALELIKSLPLAGVVVTGDAAFTLKSIAQAIRERGGHYFLPVKGNQPELETEVKKAFGDVSPSVGAGGRARPERRRAA